MKATVQRSITFYQVTESELDSLTVMQQTSGVYWCFFGLLFGSAIAVGLFFGELVTSFLWLSCGALVFAGAGLFFSRQTSNLIKRIKGGAN